MKHLDLFSGIGGFALAARRVGWETIGFSEIETWCIKLLKQHWPDVPQLGSITELGIDPVSLRLDSPAKTYPTLAEAPDFPESVQDYGDTRAVPFAWYDHSTRYWRTWQRCSEEGWEMFRETWPRAGMTRNGIAFRRVPLAPLTRGTGCGLLPTPNASDYRDRGNISNPSLQRRMHIGKQIGLNAYFRKGTCPMCVEGMMGYPQGWTNLLSKD